MAWQDEAIPTLRVLVNDLDTVSPTYSDDRLEQTLVVAARIASQEINFTNSYTVSIENVTISPDPLTTNSDQVFVNMIILKAACIVDQSTFRTKSVMEGIKATLGPANLQVSGHLNGFKTLLEQGPCATYAQLRDELLWNDTKNVKAIMSPFSSNKADFRYMTNNYYAPPEERSIRPSA